MYWALGKLLAGTNIFFTKAGSSDRYFRRLSLVAPDLAHKTIK